MKIIAILHRSAGNDVVGDMWKETKVFDVETSTIKDIIKWVEDKNNGLRTMHLEITLAQED